MIPIGFSGFILLVGMRGACAQSGKLEPTTAGVKGEVRLTGKARVSRRKDSM